MDSGNVKNDNMRKCSDYMILGGEMTLTHKAQKETMKYETSLYNFIT